MENKLLEQIYSKHLIIQEWPHNLEIFNLTLLIFTSLIFQLLWVLSLINYLIYTDKSLDIKYVSVNTQQALNSRNASNFLKTRLLVYIKIYKAGAARLKRSIGQGRREGGRAPMPPPCAPLSPDLHVFTNPEAPSLLFFDSSMVKF